MRKDLSTILIVCLVITIAVLVQQVMTINVRIAKVQTEIESFQNSLESVTTFAAPGIQIDYESAVRMWNDRGVGVVPIDDPSIERAMQIDRLQRIVPIKRDRLRSWEVQPLEENGVKDLMELLPEAAE